MTTDDMTINVHIYAGLLFLIECTLYTSLFIEMKFCNIISLYFKQILCYFCSHVGVYQMYIPNVCFYNAGYFVVFF